MFSSRTVTNDKYRLYDSCRLPNVACIIPARPIDKVGVSRLAEQAQDLLDAALAATKHGEPCTEMTILIAPDGAIRMCAESDWPLDSLAREQGARAVFRIAEQDGRVSVCGREGAHSCFLESRSQHAIARLLLRP
jgi:hypothetical protein